MNKLFKVFIDRPYYSDAVEFTFVAYRNGKTYRAKPFKLEFEEVSEAAHRQPTFQINGYDATEFLEALRLAVEGKGVGEVGGELKATKYHLEDLRNLVFKKENG